MAAVMYLSLSKSTFQSPGRQSNHETTSPQRQIDPLRLASLCLIALIASIGDVTHLTSAALTSLEESPVYAPTIYSTLLPTALGTILAAAALPFLTEHHTTQQHTQQQHTHLPPFTSHILLALTTLVTTTLHILAHAIPRLISGNLPQQPQSNATIVPLITTVTTNLLLGFARACTLALTMYLSGGGARLRAVCAAAALGVVLRAVGSEAGGYGRDGGGYYGGGVVGCGWWLWSVGEVVLGLVAAAGLVLPGVAVAGEGQSGEQAMGKDEKTGDEMVPLVPRDGGGYYPPPASRTTIFGALFAFAYHAAAVAIPGGLDLLAAHGRNNMAGQSLPLSTTAAFWSGIAVTRFLALPCDRITRSKQGVHRTVLAAGGFLVLFWLSPSSARNTAVAAGLVGAMLGPVYPCVLSMVMRELGEDEMLGATGIIVAFGYSGAVSALLAFQLAAYIDTPAILQLVLVTIFGGMLVFWEGLTVENERGSVSDLRDTA